MPGPGRRDHQGDSKLESQQTAGIVDQAFAFQHIDDAPRQAKAFGNCGRGDGIGSRDHRSENRAQTIVEAGNQPACAQRDANNGEADQAKGQHKNAYDVVREVAPRGVKTPNVKQRGQNNQKHHIGIERNLR
jgi:hypothetical protein